MKRLLAIAFVLFTAPVAVFAASSVPWQTNSPANGWITPSLVNGVNQGVLVAASSTIGNGTNGLTVFGTTTLTGNSSAIFQINYPSTTTPFIQFDNSVANAGIGLLFRGQPLGTNAGMIIQPLSQATNEDIGIASKGAGATRLRVGSTDKLVVANSSNSYTNVTHSFVSSVSNGAATVRFSVPNSTDTALTASTEATHTYFNLGNTKRTHATGSYTTQRDFRITGTNHYFAAGGGTVTDAAALAIDAPAAGDLATFTNVHALLISATSTAFGTGSATNSYGLTVNAQTGASNNYAAEFLGGNVGVATSAPATTLSVSGNGYFTGGIGIGGVNTTAGDIGFTGCLFSIGTACSNSTIAMQIGTSSTDTRLGLYMRASSVHNLMVSNAPGTSYVGLSLDSTGGNSSLSMGYAAAPTTALTKVLTMVENGRVGIGTSTPTAQFAINPDGIGNLLPFAIGSTTRQLFSVSNVGVTTALSNILVATNFAYFGTTADSRNAYIPIGGSSVGTIKSIGDFIFQTGTGSTEAARISGTNQNIGIGTTTPFAQVSVATPNGADGSASTLFAVASSTQAGATTTVFSITSKGNVGIGTTSPFAALSVDRGGSGIASSSIVVTEYRPATSTSALLDCRTSNTTHWRMGTAATTLQLTGLVPGQNCMVIVENPNASAGAITWSVTSGYTLLWPSGTAPTQTTTANKTDVWSFKATQGSSTIQVLGAASLNF